MDPFEGAKMVGGGIVQGAQLHQGQQRIDENKRRGDMLEDRNRWDNIRSEAGLRDEYGWDDGEAPQPGPEGGPSFSGGGTKQGPGLDMPGYAPPSESVSTRSTPNLSSDADVAGPLGAMSAFGAGDVRNQPQVLERLQMATEGSIAPMGQRPREVQARADKKRTGGMMYDTYNEMLDLDPSMRGLMEETGAMPPIMQPHQTSGYGSNEAMVEDSYAMNRVSSPVLAAAIRAASTEGRGGYTQNKLNEIVSSQFSNAVYNYIDQAKAAGQEMTIQQAYNDVYNSDPGYRMVNITMDDLARGFQEFGQVGELGGLGGGEEGMQTFDPSVSAAVTEMMNATNAPATLARIQAQYGTDPNWMKAFEVSLAHQQQISMSERAGIPYILRGRN